MGLVFIVSGYLKIMSVSMIILPTVGIEFGIALVFPNAFVGAITPFPAMLGAAGALYGCLQIAITFASSVVVAILDEKTQLPMGVLLLVVAILGLSIYGLLKQPHWETLSKPKILDKL